MSSAMTRSRSGDRFYKTPPARQQEQLQQLLKQKQQQEVQIQTQRPPHKEETRLESSVTGSDEAALSKPSLSSSPSTPNLTNLDRLIDSVTPSARIRGWRKREASEQPFYCLGDLWESFREWSVYGVGVPLVFSGGDSVKQYYVPYLSGIQLYLDPRRLRRRSQDNDADSSRGTASDGSSDCEAEKRAKSGVEGASDQHNLLSLNSQKLQRLALRDKLPERPSNEETEIANSHGLLVFEYLEQEQPHLREPLYDKVSNLASNFPELKRYRSCDLLPTSWLSVAWYPIYRIPMGPTLQNLDASFLTFHPLSTPIRSLSKNHVQTDASSGRKVYSVVASSKMISLPAFGLASYKLRGSFLTPSGTQEWQRANSLLEAADSWLHKSEVTLPDYQFFVSHNSQWR